MVVGIISGEADWLIVRTGSEGRSVGHVDTKVGKGSNLSLVIAIIA